MLGWSINIYVFKTTCIEFFLPPLDEVDVEDGVGRVDYLSLLSFIFVKQN